jgi:type I restriction enzyme S subunit
VAVSNLFLYLKNMQNVILRKARGVNTEGLTLAHLKSLDIPVPPLNLQNQFAQHIEKIEQQKQYAQASLEKSEILFNSLLQQAFKGELTQSHTL